MTYCTIPVNAIRSIVAKLPEYHWLIFDSKSRANLAEAYEVFQLMICDYTLSQFYDMYSIGKPLFRAASLDPFETYDSLDRSADMVNRLLMHQYGDIVKVKAFLTDLVSWFNKKGMRPQGCTEISQKMNTIAIVGQQNSGKNYFFD